MKLIDFILVPAAALTLALPIQAQSVPAPVPPAPPEAQPSLAAPASQPKPHHPFAFRQALQARMVQSLHLTPEQRIQAKAIRQRTVSAVKAIRANAALTPDQRAVKVSDAVRVGYRQFREILTDEQREKFFRLQQAARRLQRLMNAP